MRPHAAGKAARPGAVDVQGSACREIIAEDCLEIAVDPALRRVFPRALPLEAELQCEFGANRWVRIGKASRASRGFDGIIAVVSSPRRFA